VREAKRPNAVWLFGGQGALLETNSECLTPLAGSGFLLKVNAKVDQIAGTLFECGDARNGIALSMEDERLCFAVTAGGKTRILRSPDPLIPTMWYAVTAEVDSDGRLYLVVKNQDPVALAGPGLLTAPPRGRIRIGENLTGRIRDLEVIKVER
jgi:hypothetical protein